MIINKHLDMNTVTQMKTELLNEILLIKGISHETYIKRNVELYALIGNVLGKTFKEKLYNFIFDTTYPPSCPTCGVELKLISLTKGYRKWCCNRCMLSDNNYQRQRKNTNKHRYGSENLFQSKIIREKAKTTNKEKYGTEEIFASHIIKAKIKQQNLDQFGVEFNAQRDDVKVIIKQNNISKYGVENVGQLKVVKNKVKLTMIKNGWLNADGTSTQKLKDTQRAAHVKNGTWFDFNDEKVKLTFKTYKRRVRYLTNKTIKNTSLDISGRGIKGTHIDHKLSIMNGFTLGIAPEIIAHIENLQILTYRENIAKSSSSTISLDELLQLISKSELKNDANGFF